MVAEAMQHAKRRGLFLDRDGIVNKAIVRNGKPYSPRTLSEFELYSHIKPIVEQARRANFLVFVVTNQPDVGRGEVSQEAVEVLHQHTLKQLPIDKIYCCFHAQDGLCNCRKPAPGLLLQAALEFNLELSQSIMIGDRWKDIVAGQAAGCRTIWFDYHYYDDAGPPVTPTYRCSTVPEFEQAINHLIAENR
jgi:D-glycero-D-manno-heptose 1,7-bisphosphate phosphatase